MSPSRSPLRTIALEPGVELRRGQPLTLNEEGLAVPAGQGDELLGTFITYHGEQPDVYWYLPFGAELHPWRSGPGSPSKT